MLDRLKDISSILIIPTAILYFLGFVCITSYLAQFEIVSFDVVNARYLIAGFYPLIGLIIALVIALYADDRLSMSAREDNIRRFHTYKSRFALYFFYLVSIFSGSLILKFLISLVEYEPTPRTTPLSFNPLAWIIHSGYEHAV